MTSRSDWQLLSEGERYERLLNTEAEVEHLKRLLRKAGQELEEIKRGIMAHDDNDRH